MMDVIPKKNAGLVPTFQEKNKNPEYSGNMGRNIFSPEITKRKITTQVVISTTWVVILEIRTGHPVEHARETNLPVNRVSRMALT